jgi:hypothetical protein
MQDDEDNDLSVREFLERRGGRGVKLPTALVDKLEDHIQNVLEIQEVQDLVDLGDDGLVDVYNAMFENTEEDPSGMYVSLIRKWSNGAPASFPSPNATRNKTDVGSGLGPVSVGPRSSQKTVMLKDLERLGFSSPAQQTAFDISLNNGTVHEEAEVVGEEWGKDPVTTEAGIARRKAKTGDSFPELLIAGNGPGILELFSCLVREYTLRGKTAEANAITSFQTCLLEIFGADYKAIVEYLKAYRRKYRGRGIPVELDISLVVKGMKSTDTSALREELNQQKEQVKSLSKQLASLVSRLDQLSSKVAQSNSNGGGGGDKRGPPPTYKCARCGVAGDHWVSKCPLKNEIKEEKDE